jgi:addiction module HigA family antidote
LLEDFMKPLGLSMNELARDLHVPVNRISAIVHGKRAITADTSMRLAKYFGMSVQFWLGLQMHYELACAEDRSRGEIERTVHPLRRPRKAA